MIDSRLYSAKELDKLINSTLQGDIENMEEYAFEGAEYNRRNFNRLLVFYDNKLFDKASLDINQLTRWFNAYYWYSVYISELKKQNISIETHSQARFKLIEQMDHYASSEFDWSFIEQIEDELGLK